MDQHHIESEDPNRSVLVCIDGKKFQFEVQTLMECSTYFETMFSRPYKESTQKEIVLNEVDLQAFQFFRDWLLRIGTDFIGLDHDMLLRLLILGDYLLLHTLQAKCHEYIGYWLDNEITFPCKLLETYMVIGDIKLKDMLNDWIYNKQLKTPLVWTIVSIQATNEATLKFRERMERMVEGAPKEGNLYQFAEELKKIVLDHENMVQKEFKQAKARLEEVKAKFQLVNKEDNPIERAYQLWKLEVEIEQLIQGT